MLCTVLWIEVSTKNGLLALKDCKIWKNRKRNRQRNTVLSNGTSSLRKNGRFQWFPLQAVLTRARMSSWQVRPTSCPYNLELRVIFEWWRCTFLSRRFRPPPSLGTSLLLHLWISPLCWRLAKPNPQVRPFSPTANSDFRGRPSSPWDIAWPNAHSLPLPHLHLSGTATVYPVAQGTKSWLWHLSHPTANQSLSPATAPCTEWLSTVVGLYLCICISLFEEITHSFGL